MEAEAVSFSRVCYLKISVSVFLVLLFRCWAGRETRLHNFYLTIQPVGVSSIFQPCVSLEWKSGHGGLALSTPAPSHLGDPDTCFLD